MHSTCPPPPPPLGVLGLRINTLFETSLSLAEKGTCSIQPKLKF